jgi:hypothetical protein
MGVLMKPANSHGYAIFVLRRPSAKPGHVGVFWPKNRSGDQAWLSATRVLSGARARGGCVLQLPACFLLSRAHHAEYEIGRVGNSEIMR